MDFGYNTYQEYLAGGPYPQTRTEGQWNSARLTNRLMELFYLPASLIERITPDPVKIALGEGGGMIAAACASGLTWAYLIHVLKKRRRV